MLVYLFWGVINQDILVEWLGQVGVVSVGMMINSVIGRLLIHLIDLRWWDRDSRDAHGYGAWRKLRIWHDTGVITYKQAQFDCLGGRSTGLEGVRRYAYLGWHFYYYCAGGEEGENREVDLGGARVLWCKAWVFMREMSM